MTLTHEQIQSLFNQLTRKFHIPGWIPGSTSNMHSGIPISYLLALHQLAYPDSPLTSAYIKEINHLPNLNQYLEQHESVFTIIHLCEGNMDKATLMALGTSRGLVLDEALTLAFAKPGRTTLAFTKPTTIPGVNHLILIGNRALTADTVRAIRACIPTLLGLTAAEGTPPLEQYIQALVNGETVQLLKAWLSYPPVATFIKNYEEALRFEKIKAIQNFEPSAIQRTYLERQAEQLNSRLEELFEALRIKQDELEQMRMRIFSLNYSPAEEGSTLFDALKNHIDNILYTEKYSDNSIKLGLRAPANYNEYLLTTMLNSPRDNDWNQFAKTPVGKLVLIDKTHSLPFTSEITIDFRNKSFSAYQDSSAIKFNCALNPHLSKYNCFGNSRTALRTMLEQGDWMLFIQQLLYTVGNINLADGAPMRYMSSVFGRYINPSDQRELLLYNRRTRQYQTVQEALNESHSNTQVDNTSTTPGAGAEASDTAATEA